MIWVLIAYGPNSVEIPCRVFSTREKAVESCTKLLGPPNKEKDGALTWHVWASDTLIGDGGDLKREIAKQLFTSHYFGCGGCGALHLTAVKEDTPFVTFDLD